MELICYAAIVTRTNQKVKKKENLFSPPFIEELVRGGVGMEGLVYAHSLGVLIYEGPNLSKNFYHLYFTLCQILGR